MPERYPMKLIPAFKDYLWGGTRLKTDFQKETTLDKVAESWELSSHKDGPSTVANGSYQGLTLPVLLEQTGTALLGTNCERFDQFPILIKLIDARDNLSVQVHPDNQYALAHEGEYGKTEMWVIVDCEPGAELIYGFRENISREMFEASIRDNTLLSVVDRVPVKKGDVFFIEAGTLHAIGKGILIAEIQQNSNTTYRVYDYGRLGADGKPRPLHIEKALDVTCRTPAAHKPGPQGTPVREGAVTRTLLASCAYFTVTSCQLDGSMTLFAGEESFQSLLLLDGEAALCWTGEPLKLKKGDSVLVPAQMGEYKVEGTASFLLTQV